MTSPTRHRHGQAAGNLDDEQQRQLTTLAGWRQFVNQTPAPPELLPEHDWARLGELERLTYDEDRLNHHARLLVVATPRSARSSPKDAGCPTSTATPTPVAAD